MANDVPVLYTINVEGVEEGMEEIMGIERRVCEQNDGRSGGLQRMGKGKHSKVGSMISHIVESTASRLEMKRSLFQ
jgi:hypothetical protein